MTVRPLVYLDNSATTRLDPRVAEAMRPHLEDSYGNPSSLHAMGREARAAVEEARASVAGLVNARPREIVFTGSGTEANNLALLGAVGASGAVTPHMVASAFEHPSVLEPCARLRALGADVTLLPVGGDGIVEPGELARAMRPETVLVSIMTANNVVGTLQPIAELARVARSRGALFHTDAVQAAGRVPIEVSRDDVDLLSLSAHKLHGPKGVGALFVRTGVRIAPQVHGGGQEQGLRSATENVAGIAGFGRAAEIAAAARGEEAARLVNLRDRLLEAICGSVPGAYLIGHPHRRLPGHLCIGISGLEPEAMKLLLALDEQGFAVSTGSACSSSHASEPSHVLMAMGFDPVRARGSLRITLGRFNTDEEALAFADALRRVAATLRPITTRKIPSERTEPCRTR
ncbi:MAG: cysteine desulfurase family protein [Deltaproteobacteria bacterium]|nr:cysteine desulfurase family protein [Deltaproteobacteria bacterium]